MTAAPWVSARSSSLLRCYGLSLPSSLLEVVARIKHFMVHHGSMVTSCSFKANAIMSDCNRLFQTWSKWFKDMCLLVATCSRNARKINLNRSCSSHLLLTCIVLSRLCFFCSTCRLTTHWIMHGIVDEHMLEVLEPWASSWNESTYRLRTKLLHKLLETEENTALGNCREGSHVHQSLSNLCPLSIKHLCSVCACVCPYVSVFISRPVPWNPHCTISVNTQHILRSWQRHTCKPGIGEGVSHQAKQKHTKEIQRVRSLENC